MFKIRHALFWALVSTLLIGGIGSEYLKTGKGNPNAIAISNKANAIILLSPFVGLLGYGVLNSLRRRTVLRHLKSTGSTDCEAE